MSPNFNHRISTPPNSLDFLKGREKIEKSLLRLRWESGVARSTAETYFAILEDTLLGHFLPAWRPRLKVREAAHPTKSSRELGRKSGSAFIQEGAPMCLMGLRSSPSGRSSTPSMLARFSERLRTSS